MIHELLNSTLSPLGVPVHLLEGSADYPHITYEVFGESGTEFGDGKELATTYRIQVDVWSKEDCDALVNQVKTVMKNAGFKRTDADDLFEPDTKVYHTAIQFNYFKRQ